MALTAEAGTARYGMLVTGPILLGIGPSRMAILAILDRFIPNLVLIHSERTAVLAVAFSDGLAGSYGLKVTPQMQQETVEPGQLSITGC